MVDASETTTDFRGAIVVPGSEAANREVARSGGCEGCEWTLVLNCDRNTPVDPAETNCNATRCPDGTWYRLYLQRPSDPAPTYVDHVCLSRTRRIVTAEDLAFDVQRHLTRLAPPATEFTVQPDGRVVTGQAAFFAAEGPAADSTELAATTGGISARLKIEIAPSRYTWAFGDGATCETDAPGGRYDGRDGERCDDRVAHVYATSSEVEVTLRATWAGTYTFDAGFGPVGPLPIPGNGVDGPVERRTVRVREARATLVGG